MSELEKNLKPQRGKHTSSQPIEEQRGVVADFQSKHWINKLFRNILHKREWFFGLVVVFVLAIIASQVVSLHNSKTKCGKSILQEAATSMNSISHLGLQQTAIKIQKIKNYQQDANCLYPVVTYYIDIGDPTNARIYLTDLEKAFDRKKSFSPYLGSKLKDITTIEGDVAFLQNHQKVIITNIQTFSSQP